MDLSLFSRDVIAMGTAIALSHGMFDAAAAARHLRQDRSGTADRCFALRPFAGAAGPRRPMPSGLPNKEKQRVRQLYAEGKVGRRSC